MSDKLNRLPNGDIMYEGIVYPGKQRSKEIIFDSEKWILEWSKAITEIKSMNLDHKEIMKIHSHFLNDLLSYQYSEGMRRIEQDVAHISTNLTIAFCKAYSNYRESKGKIYWLIGGLFGKRIIDQLSIPRIDSTK